MDLLRWWRFLGAAGVVWDQATRAEARDFCSWIQIVGKPVRPHWRQPGAGGSRARPAQAGAGVPNPVTGKPAPGARYAPATVAHCETVLRSFYDFHLEAGTGPMVNPFPLARTTAGQDERPPQPDGSVLARSAADRYRPRMTRRMPRQIPDVRFDELFARLGSHRDRALLAFWISTGARASELLGVLCAEAPIRDSS